jgi:hypothetical protein
LAHLLKGDRVKAKGHFRQADDLNRTDAPEMDQYAWEWAGQALNDAREMKDPEDRRCLCQAARQRARTVRSAAKDPAVKAVVEDLVARASVVEARSWKDQGKVKNALAVCDEYLPGDRAQAKGCHLELLALRMDLYFVPETRTDLLGKNVSPSKRLCQELIRDADRAEALSHDPSVPKADRAAAAARAGRARNLMRVYHGSDDVNLPKEARKWFEEALRVDEGHPDNVQWRIELGVQIYYLITAEKNPKDRKTLRDDALTILKKARERTRNAGLLNNITQLEQAIKNLDK